MTTAITIDNLRKSFRATQALAGLSFDVDEGDVFGFLGPNGAGKTTTMRILATLLRPDSGTAKIYDYDVTTQAKHVRPIIGYMPDSSGAYRDMLVSEYLEFFAAAYRIPIHQRQRVVDDCIELTGLGFKKNELIEGLSRGMRQRLGLARCLINDPKVLILDEPASGLDPRARIEIQEILRTLGAMKKTVLISSHILSELRQLCNKICIIDHGRLLYCGTIVDALAKARTAKRLLVRLVDRQEEAGKLLVEHAGVVGVDVTDSHLVVELDPTVEDFSFVASDLVRHGYHVLTIRVEEIMLEDAFIKLTELGEAAHQDQPPAFAPGT